MHFDKLIKKELGDMIIPSSDEAEDSLELNISVVK